MGVLWSRVHVWYQSQGPVAHGTEGGIMLDLRVAGMNTRLALAALLTLSWVAGCSDTPTDPTPDPLPEGMVVSDPEPAPAAAVPLAEGVGPAGGQIENLVYVSLAPATAPGGATATMTNLNSGRIVTTAVQDGGFDPTPVIANTGIRSTRSNSVRVSSTSTRSLPASAT